MRRTRQATSRISPHADWLQLVEVSGPFLSLPVLDRALPQGVTPVDSDTVARLRAGLDELRDDPALVQMFVDFVLGEILQLGHQVVTGPAVPATLAVTPPDAGETLRPDRVVMDGDGPALLVRTYPADTALDRPLPKGRWAATPVERMVELCRGTGVALGLVTNGWQWSVVHTRPQAPTGVLTFDADLWPEERATLDAFADLLGAYRFFAVAADDTLTALLAESADAQTEVTDQLGRQVRAAVELLVDAFSRADRDSGESQLAGLAPREVYLGAVTVTMRLVFLLYAEEHRLFPLGDPLYDRSYAASTLLGQLRADADRASEEVLERRPAAWPRLLATFRAVHGGVRHEALRMPAYGGSLFEPARHRWLERIHVDDRTLLFVLQELQVIGLRGRASIEAQRLSYRSLDVEQIGYVYEGLLDHSAVRADEPYLALLGSKEPELPLTRIETWLDRGELVERLTEQTGLSAARIRKLLDTRLDPQAYALLRAACDGDDEVATRMAPYWHLLRPDLRGGPLVYPAGSTFVTQTGDRRTAGAHYTPKSLAEEVVTHTLDPLIYDPGPAQGATDGWRVKPADELLRLRIVDMAMGSAAFLVGACRYLADRLVEAWARDGAPDGVPADENDRLLHARRLVADRCLFGVDRDPMAVEMAKLSLWLVTLAKGRPFSFLDHALRCGDSLLGLHAAEQLRFLHLDPARGNALHSDFSDVLGVIEVAMKEAAERRRELEAFPVIDIRDADRKARLHAEAEARTEILRICADTVTAAALSTSGRPPDILDTRLDEIKPDVLASLNGEVEAVDRLRARTREWLEAGRPAGAPQRRPFHWPLEFPEVFANGGFDAVVGNPPFQGGQRITGNQGEDYRELLVRWLAHDKRGSADLVSYFFLRAAAIAAHGRIGLLATNTIGQGDTREVGLDQLVAADWSIVRAFKSRPWLGTASLEIAIVWLGHTDVVEQCVLDGRPVRGITPSLDPASRVTGIPHRLTANRGLSFQGSNILGLGFTMAPDDARALIDKDPRNAEVLFPYLNGEDVNSRPDCSASRWVINFRDWPLERAQLYPDCLSMVRKKVKPDRDKNNRANYRDYWWRYGEHRPGLYKAIADLDRVLVIVLHSKAVVPLSVVSQQVFSHGLAIFATDQSTDLALLSSGVHYWWAIERSSTLETRIRYTPSDVFETFARPTGTERMAWCGTVLDEERRAIMLDRDEGLTTTYNRVHDPSEHSADVARLREIHGEIDEAVKEAYGWADLDLDHGFHETRQGMRFTIGPVARTEVLDRLLQLNLDRHAEEVELGLVRTKRARRTSKRSDGTGPVLF